jgi:hypothetical protein
LKGRGRSSSSKFKGNKLSKYEGRKKEMWMDGMKRKGKKAGCGVWGFVGQVELRLT